jgi:hypothetical protein
MNFDSFEVVFTRGADGPLLDKGGADLSDNVLIHAMIRRDLVLVFVSREGLGDILRFPPKHLEPRPNRPTLDELNAVVDRHIDVFRRIALAKVLDRHTLTVTDRLKQTRLGVLITEQDMRRSGETITADVLKTAAAAGFQSRS